MSLSDDVRAVIFLADYANVDATGKVNAVGAGWQVTFVQPGGSTAPHTLSAHISTPPQDHGSEFSVTFTLRDEAGKPVALTGPAGEPQVMRIQQIAKVDRPMMPGVITQGKVWGLAHVILNFPNGLPLPANQAYTWDLEIEGSSDPQWVTSFYVSGPAQPILG